MSIQILTVQIETGNRNRQSHSVPYQLEMTSEYCERTDSVAADKRGQRYTS